MSDMTSEFANRFQRQNRAYTAHNNGGYGASGCSYNNGSNGYSRGSGSYSSTQSTQSTQSKGNAAYGMFKKITEQGNVADELNERIKGKELSVFEYHGMIVAKTPYSEESKNRYKALNGLFYKDSKCWFFALEKKDELVKALRELYPQHSRAQNSKTQMQKQSMPQNNTQSHTQSVYAANRATDTCCPSLINNNRADTQNLEAQQPNTQNGAKNLPENAMILELVTLMNIKDYFAKNPDKSFLIKGNNLYVNKSYNDPFAFKAAHINAVYLADACVWLCHARYKNMV